MIETHLRPSFQKVFVDPMVQYLSEQLRVTSASVTFIALISGLMAASAILLQQPWLAVVLLVFSGYCDVLDGSLARFTHAASARGAVLDIVVDRVVEFSVILALFYVDPSNRGGPALWILGSSFVCITTFLVVGIFSQNQGEKSFHYSSGLIERFEAFAFFIAMVLLPRWFVALACAYAILVFYTAVRRVMQFWQHVKEPI